MTPASTTAVLLAAFEASAATAGEAEASLRKRMEADIRRLERERAFACRRLNFVRALSGSIASADSEEAAVAAGRTIVRAEVGWDSDSESRSEVLTQLAPVMQAIFACLISEAPFSPRSATTA